MKFLVHLVFPSAALALALSFFSAQAVFAVDPEPVEITQQRFDGEGRFLVIANVQAGFRHAILEEMAAPAQPQGPATWRPVLATALDGRAATILFRLPKETRTRALVRVTAGTDTTFATPHYTDPALCSVYYGGGLTEMMKVALLNQASDKSAEVAELSRAQRFQHVVNWAKTQPYVVGAKVDRHCNAVMIELIDEDVVTLFAKPKPTDEELQHDFPDGRPDEPEDAGEAAPLPPAALASVSAPPSSIPAPLARRLPTARRAICANFLEADFPNSVPTLAGWLNAKGYQATEHGQMTVPQFRTLLSGGPIAVMFMHAHGFPYEFKDKEYIAISLNQVTQLTAEDVNYAAWRQAGELKMGKEEKSPNPPVYGFTRVFIRNNMKNSFADHSLVVADTCFGSDAELGMAFNDVGVGAYASWNWESGKQSNSTIEKLFDRLLGANQATPVSIPHERPFSLPVVHTWMKEKGYEYDPTFKWNLLRTKAKMVFRLHPSKPAFLLRPSIRNIEYGSTVTHTSMVLKGDFGDDPGTSNRKVFWGNTEMNVRSWDLEEGISIGPIPVPVPVGNLKVEVRSHFVSNLTPMTEWTVPFKYVVKGLGSLEYTIDATYKLRFDVHGYRDKPEQAVQYDYAPFMNNADFTGTTSGTGIYDEPNGEAGTTRIEWAGSRTLHSNDLGGNGNPLNSLFASAQLNTRTGLVQPFMIGCISSIDLKNDGSVVSSPSVGYDTKTSAMMSLQFERSTDWMLKSGTFTGDAPMLNRAVSSSMSWPSVMPQAFPTTDTER